MAVSSSRKPEPGVLLSAAKRVMERCDRLAECSDEPGRLTRTFCSPAMKQAHQQLSTWMTGADMQCSVDAVGNLIGRKEPPTSDRVFMIGSHVDTVINAGKFDGPLGVLLGLAAVEVLDEIGAELPFGIHVVGFSEEEGVRYRFPFIGSLGIAGCLDDSELAQTDADGISMRDALSSFGCNPTELGSARYEKKRMIGFMEAHIEQAVVLEDASLPVGVVTAIAGQTRAKIRIDGVAGHAGTVPHDRRQDALAAAAELILRIESIGKETPGLFATVGSLDAIPGLSNVIPGRAELRLDLRHENDQVRSDAFDRIQASLKRICADRHVEGCLETVEHTPAVAMDSTLSEVLSKATEELVPKVTSMVSGAGHDAMIMSQIAPTCMLFIRCRNGVSHHPEESVSEDDICTALNVMVETLIRIGEKNLAETMQ